MPFLVLLAWALLLCAWVFGNPPFAAPDEVDHYVRAVGISEGHLLGAPDRQARVGDSARQVAWTVQAARTISLPAYLDPNRSDCRRIAERSAACFPLPSPSARRPTLLTLLTTVGNYQPFPYLAPALTLRAGASASSALRLARATQALLVLGLLAVGVFALCDAESPVTAMLGLLLAVTPMAIFCAASLGGSGLEIAAVVAFLACLLRLDRPSRGSAAAGRTRWWLLAALSGSTLALSRTDGPAWLLLSVLLALGLHAASGRSSRSRFRNRAALPAAVTLLLAAALNRAWEAHFGSRFSLDTGQLHAGLSAGVREWWKALPDPIGKFGYLDVKLPSVVPIVWFALILALALLAFINANRRERALSTVTLSGCLLAPIVFYALLLRPTGFGLQGRHVLPMLVALPLLAGETLNRHREHVPARWLRLICIVVPVGVGAIQLTAWCVNAKHYATGVHNPADAHAILPWIPPGGWWPWLALSVCAGLSLAMPGLLAASIDRRLDPPAP